MNGPPHTHLLSAFMLHVSNMRHRILAPSRAVANHTSHFLRGQTTPMGTMFKEAHLSNVQNILKPLPKKSPALLKNSLKGLANPRS